MRALGVAVVVALVPRADAEVVAVEPDHTDAPNLRPERYGRGPALRRPPHPPAGLGANAAVGWLADGGWVARLDYEVLPVMAQPFGGVFGFVSGFEYWRAAPDHGFAMPIVIAGGIRAFPGRALIGLGFESFLVDKRANDRGLGFMAPIAMANVGLDLWGFRLAADARAIRRWQFGAEDFTQYQLAITLGYTGSTIARARGVPIRGSR